MTSVLFWTVLPHCTVPLPTSSFVEVERAAARRVAVERVPLPVDAGIGDAGVAAREGAPEVVGARDAEVGEREVVEVQAPGGIDGELRVAAAVAGRRLAAQRASPRGPT